MRYENLTFDEERALYGVRNADIRYCSFAGPADGESALKESAGISVSGSRFLLRYPLWHVDGGSIVDSVMADTCRAALWYDRNMRISDCRLNGIKALRECDETILENCRINSAEFGWLCRGIEINSCSIDSEYPFFQSRNITAEGLSLNGKYSFQYVENMTVRNSDFTTKDAFWHSKNVTIYDSVIRGEYLGWYSYNLKLVRCRIIGTQPLCYVKNLIMEDCEMVGCDLAFEKSDVNVTVRGGIDSVKNPKSGSISADEIGAIILDNPDSPGKHCEIRERMKDMPACC